MLTRPSSKQKKSVFSLPKIRVFIYNFGSGSEKQEITFIHHSFKKEIGIFMGSF
jgi:hypothetical protein